MSTIHIDALEQVYEALAQGIDRAGPEQEAVFLAKLALLLANEIGRSDTFRQCVASALADLEGPHGSADRVDVPNPTSGDPVNASRAT